MGLTISTILKRQAEIVAKVKGAGYLEKRVSENLLVLQQCLDSRGLVVDDLQDNSDDELSDDDLDDVERLALKELRTLEANKIFFSAQDYIAYRPLPLNLTGEEALSFMRKEFSQWLRLNYLQNELLAHSKGSSDAPNDNLLRAVAKKLTIDSGESNDWIPMARESADSAHSLGHSFPISFKDLENLERGTCDGITENRDRRLFIRHILERALQDTVPLSQWGKAFIKTMEMSHLIPKVQSTVAPERRSEFLNVWQKSFPSSVEADSGVDKNSRLSSLTSTTFPA